MRYVLPAALGALSLFGLQACGDGDRPAAGPDPAPAAGPAADPVATDGALGLTRLQLEDADLVGADGRDLGDVERALTDASGRVEALVVEVDEARGDRLVRLPLDGLAPVRRGDDHDLRTTMTREQLLALPAWRP